MNNGQVAFNANEARISAGDRRAKGIHSTDIGNVSMCP